MRTAARRRPRRPQQQRGHDRVAQIQAAAEALLLTRGFEDFSFTELAAQLDCTRPAVYKFFPTPQAIFHALGQRQLDRLESTLAAAAQALPPVDWRSQVAQMVRVAADFHNGHPVARLLILGAPQGEDSYRSLESTIQRLGRITRQILQRHDMELPEAPADCAMLAVEIATACLRTSFFLHGEITPAYRDEATRAMTAYLERFATGA